MQRWILAALVLAALGTRPALAKDSEVSAPCFITVAELHEWRGRDGLVVVDTRSDGEFRKVRIPGSIRAAAHSLRTRTHLRERPLLLIGRAGTGAELEPTCRELRDAGFATIAVLEGGLASWTYAGGELSGDAAAVRSPTTIAAADVWRERNGGRWLVVDVTARGDAAVRDLARHAVRLPAADPNRLRQGLHAVLAKRSRRHRTTFVVLVDDHGRQRATLAAALAELDLPHLYILDDGAVGLQRFRQAQAAILAARTRDCPFQLCGAR